MNRVPGFCLPLPTLVFREMINISDFFPRNHDFALFYWFSQSVFVNVWTAFF
jgi:hypothetical protein